MLDINISEFKTKAESITPSTLRQSVIDLLNMIPKINEQIEQLKKRPSTKSMLLQAALKEQFSALIKRIDRLNEENSSQPAAISILDALREKLLLQKKTFLLSNLPSIAEEYTSYSSETPKQSQPKQVSPTAADSYPRTFFAAASSSPQGPQTTASYSLEEPERFVSLLKNKNEADVLTFLHEHSKFLVHFVDENGYTPLLLSKIYNMPCVSDNLISRGAKYTTARRENIPYQWFSEEGFAVLIHTIIQNDLQAFRAIADSGALPFQKEHNGLVLTSFVASLGRLDFLKKILMKDKSEIEAGSVLGKVTPLIAATKNKHEDVVAFLLLKHAHISYHTHEGETAFRVAEENNYPAITKKLAAASSLDIPISLPTSIK